MFTRLIITAVTTGFLGAAAYAVVPQKSQTAVLIPLNTSTIEKNQNWPKKGNISLDPCAGVVCKAT